MDASRFQYFTIITSFLSLTLHYLQSYLFHIFSPTSRNVAFAFSIYSQLAVVFSFIGVVGSVRKSPRLTQTFSHFFLLDTFISAGIRFTILFCFLGIRQGVCLGYIQVESGVEQAQIRIDSDLRLTNEGCLDVVNLVIGVLALALCCSISAQLFLATMVREYAVCMYQELKHDKLDGDRLPTYSEVKVEEGREGEVRRDASGSANEKV